MRLRPVRHSRFPLELTALLGEPGIGIVAGLILGALVVRAFVP